MNKAINAEIAPLNGGQKRYYAIATELGTKTIRKECGSTMEFELALQINVALFTLYTIVLIIFSLDEAKRGEKGETIEDKKAA